MVISSLAPGVTSHFTTEYMGKTLGVLPDGEVSVNGIEPLCLFLCVSASVALGFTSYPS